MPKGKGGKHQKRKKRDADADGRELIFKEEGQDYAIVMKMLGGGRLDAYCMDGKRRICHIRGRLRRIRLHVGDLVLISVRPFQTDKADVLHKYLPDEMRALQKYNEITDISTIIDQQSGLDFAPEGEEEGEEMSEVDEGDLDAL
ncbi:translation initiation factor 1A [Kipferlia bialata]|uniref:Eukaryotic translation initiation factor 4C n=1 Tax=Kipferlia bialata TaxID=797122 RepID=A0A9K3D584_9EUKA|nr:translation initiation factor 1A [Kipferlia bialata]|eukprot:g9579.t1